MNAAEDQVRVGSPAPSHRAVGLGSFPRSNSRRRFLGTCLAVGSCVGPVLLQAGQAHTSLFVLSHPRVCRPGVTSRAPVRLARGYNVRNPGLGRKRLVVTGVLHGGVRRVEFGIPDVTTDANGDATVTFVMPAKLLNGAGKPVGTALDVTVRFLGEATLAPCRTGFSVVVG